MSMARIRTAAAVQDRISVSMMRNLYRVMLRIRLVEEKVAELYHEGEMRCPMHLCIGQEAVAAGVCAGLEPEDAVMSGHRAHGHYLAKGGNLKRMLAELYGRADGCCGGYGGSMHLIDLSVNFLGSTPIVASIMPVATGVAWAAKLQNRQHATVVFMGEAAAEEGVWHESLNFAALHQLPIIYVCENNLYSVYTPLAERQPQRNLAGLARAHGLTVYTGDGNDAVFVYDTAQQARTLVLADSGPVLMEFATYRWREHCGPNIDDDLGYRAPEEAAAWRLRDPIPRLEKRLREAGVPVAVLAGMRSEIEREIDGAVEFSKDSPLPESGTAGYA